MKKRWSSSFGWRTRVCRMIEQRGRWSNATRAANKHNVSNVPLLLLDTHKRLPWLNSVGAAPGMHASEQASERSIRGMHTALVITAPRTLSAASTAAFLDPRSRSLNTARLAPGRLRFSWRAT